MESNLDIIIPCIKSSHILDNTINNCLKLNKLNKIFVVIEKNENLSYENHESVKYIFVPEKTFMSKKRNIAARHSDAKYLGFMDSDSYPVKNDWSLNAINILETKKDVYIVGGPDTSPPGQSIENDSVGCAMKSFLTVGFRNFKRNTRKADYVPEVRSCNMLMERKKYFEMGMMDENTFVAEDTYLCYKTINKGHKIYYSPKVHVYHHDRSIKGFLIQRYVRGFEAADAIIKCFRKFIKRKKISKEEFQTELIFAPALSLYLLSFFLIRNFTNLLDYYYLFLYLYLFVILFETIKVCKNIKSFIYVFFILLFGTIIQSFSTLLTFFNIKLDLTKIYRNKNDQ